MTHRSYRTAQFQPPKMPNQGTTCADIPTELQLGMIKVFFPFFSLAQVGRFDLITGGEENLPEMFYAREDFPSIVLGKYLYVFGGFGSSRTVLNSCER